jgi:hypothetical protein
MDNQTRIALKLLFNEVYGYIPTEVSFLSETPKENSFTPPTLEQVYYELRKLNVRNPQENAEKFWNFYESKGWMIGKNKMKNYKSAIKTWKFEKNSLTI